MRGWVVIRPRIVGLVVAAACMAVPPTVAAQEPDPVNESAVIRRAALLEAGGRYAEAEEVLRGLLEARPGSPGGLFALERVLRARGELAEILPLIRRYLERVPHGSGARHLELRVVLEVDSLDALERVADDWIAAEPASPEPYREVARAYERAVGPERALEVLSEGRERLGEPALALETGDVLLALGRREEAVQEWSLAVDDSGAQAGAVLRRVARLGDDRREMVGSLLDALDREPTTAGRRRAGVRIALESGLEPEALEMAQAVVPGLTSLGRRGFLAELGRRGEETGARRVALWAYSTLREESRDGEEARALDARVASLALAVGDTARALEAERRVARALPPRSDTRRKVVADLIRVEAEWADDPDLLTRRMEGFRAEFPDAPELDALASEVATVLRARGEIGAAEAILEGVRGPRSSLERAFLFFEEGSVEEGREALEASLPGLDPAEATEVIQLMGLLDRLEGVGREAVVRSTVLARRGRGEEAVRVVRSAVAELPEDRRPPLLAHGARVADEAGRPDDAAELRARLVMEHPDAPETGEATLLLARHRATRPGGVNEAVRLLEELILARPEAPVVPEARRRLERLRARLPGGGSS